MTYQIREINSFDEWESFCQKLNPNTFLESPNWGQMQNELGEKVVYFGAYEDGDLVGVALGITVSAKRGSFLFCPHGPIVESNKDKKEITRLLLKRVEEYARQANLAFVRVSPLELDSKETKDFYSSLGYRPAPMHMHAETMWVLDIKPTEEDLLKGMRKTTRNLVRRAERDGVKIRISEETADLVTFEKLYEETADRENFVAFSAKYLKAEFNSFVKDHRVFFAFAEYNGDVIAGALITVYGNTGFYHQGASTRKWPKIPGAYLLQWEIIRELKKRGLERYNFWGIAPTDDPKHPWAGLSLFKQGFGGYREDYLHAQDKALKLNYWLTFIIEEIRRRKRKL